MLCLTVLLMGTACSAGIGLLLPCKYNVHMAALAARKNRGGEQGAR